MKRRRPDLILGDFIERTGIFIGRRPLVVALTAHFVLLVLEE